MDKSPLSRLPSELRNRIYELVIGNQNRVWIELLRYLTNAEHGGILRVCRAMRADTRLMFFANVQVDVTGKVTGAYVHGHKTGFVNSLIAVFGADAISSLTHNIHVGTVCRDWPSRSSFYYLNVRCEKCCPWLDEAQSTNEDAKSAGREIIGYDGRKWWETFKHEEGEFCSQFQRRL